MTDADATGGADDRSIVVSYHGRWTRMKGRSLHSVEGHYYDPKHGGCFRTIKKLGDRKFMILGVYGNDEARAAGHFWHATVTTGTVVGGKIRMSVVFSGKEKAPEHRTMTADFDVESKTILWQDKNRWVPCYCHPRQFLWTGVGSKVRTGSYIGCNPRV